MSGIKTNNKLIITEILNEINEVFDEKIPTNFKEIDYGDYFAYEFNTNSGNCYDLEFHKSFEFCSARIDNNKTLGDILAIDCDKNPTIDCFDVTMSLSINDDKEFEKETDKLERYELIGRIAFIIKKLLQKHNKTKLFVVGNSKRNNIDIYQNIFKNHFYGEFDLYVREAYHHDADIASFFIIRK